MPAARLEEPIIEENMIPFYDLRRKSEENPDRYENISFWRVQLKPVPPDTRGKKEQVLPLQEMMQHLRIFAMGWPLDPEKRDEFIKNNSPIELNSDNQEKYKSLKTGKGGSSSVDNYAKIKPGDYVVTRLMNGHYLIGKVTESARYLGGTLKAESFQDLSKFYNEKYKDEDKGTIKQRIDQDIKDINAAISWGCEVEKWIDIADPEKVPSELRGIFSASRQPTIKRIGEATDNTRLRLQIQGLYEDREVKYRLTEYGFSRCLDYKELEDLVALYIHKRHADKGYMLRPSSGKSTEQKYEFRFTNIENRNSHDITCQVKSQAPIDVDFYLGADDAKTYEVIYLFSGLDQYKIQGTTYNEEAARKEIASQKETNANVQIIQRSDLYEELKKHHIFNDAFYTYIDDREDEGILSIEKIYDKLKSDIQTSKSYEAHRPALSTNRNRKKNLNECEQGEQDEHIRGRNGIKAGSCLDRRRKADDRACSGDSGEKRGKIPFGSYGIGDVYKDEDEKREAAKYFDDNLYFVKSNGLFYSAQLGALVCSHSSFKDSTEKDPESPDYTKDEIEQIRRDLYRIIHVDAENDPTE